MTARKSLDKAIIKAITDNPEITINNLMFKLDKGGLHEGKSKRAVANHVYDLRREGVITQLGQSNNARYILTSQLEPVTEQQHQVAEAKRREATATSSAGQLGECDLIDLGPFYIIQPRTLDPEVVEPADEQKMVEQPAPAPASVIVLDSREGAEQPFDARVSAIAQHIGTTVTLTVQQLINDALREKETTIKMQRQEIAKLGKLIDDLTFKNGQQDEQIDVLERDMAEQEQLYNDLDTRYNTLKKQIGQLAA